MKISVQESQQKSKAPSPPQTMLTASLWILQWADDLLSTIGVDIHSSLQNGHITLMSAISHQEQQLYPVACHFSLILYPKCTSIYAWCQLIEITQETPNLYMWNIQSGHVTPGSSSLVRGLPLKGLEEKWILQSEAAVVCVTCLRLN